MRKLAIIFVLSILFSCRNHGYEHVPYNIIQPDTMVNVLTDVHVLQAKIQLGYYADSIHTPQKGFDELWKKHHITEEEYNTSIKYYTYHTALLSDVYEKVLSNLSEQKATQLGKKHS
jgi:hypothetical protein